MTHYTEAGLLETYYTQPGESMPVMLHLAGCSDCAARYERLERKLRELAACHTDEKPETFWSRQRLSILRQLAPRRRVIAARLAAASIVVAFALGGIATYTAIGAKSAIGAKQPQPVPAEVQLAAPEEPGEDPWESEALQDYAEVVEWETWL
ncbi:MAG TPA: hypothetical protein VF618_15550 [Thermoanaerobaculia bacterium]